MAELETDSFLDHVEALRRTLLACLAAWAVALPFGLVLARPFLSWLIRWSCPASIARLHYFSALEAFTTPLRARYDELMADRGELERILAKGAARAGEYAEAVVQEVYDKVGFLRPLR